MNQYFYLRYVPIFLLFSLSCQKDEFICADWDNVCDDDTVYVDTSKINRKALIIGVDGFRSDAMQEGISPFLHEFSQQNITYYTDRNLVQYLTFSGPNWSSLLTGVNLCKHQVTDNEYSSNSLEVFPPLFSYIERAESTINTASIVSWLPINIYTASGYADYAPVEAIQDEDVFQQGRNVLLNQDPIDADVLFLYFEELDNVGHGYGFHPDVPEYANTLATIDGYISELVSIVEDKRANGEDWIIFVVSDHGGEGTGHSGGYDNEHIKYTIFYANHPTEEFDHSYTSSQVDLVPTVLSFLGIIDNEFNCKTDGVSLIE